MCWPSSSVKQAGIRFLGGLGGVTDWLARRAGTCKELPLSRLSILRTRRDSRVGYRLRVSPISVHTVLAPAVCPDLFNRCRHNLWPIFRLSHRHHDPSACTLIRIINSIHRQVVKEKPGATIFFMCSAVQLICLIRFDEF